MKRWKRKRFEELWVLRNWNSNISHNAQIDLHAQDKVTGNRFHIGVL